MTNHDKMKEVFGRDSYYHPRQLINEKHIPAKGPCERECMYKHACKVSDLKVMQSKGLLAMGP